MKKTISFLSVLILSALSLCVGAWASELEVIEPGPPPEAASASVSQASVASFQAPALPAASDAATLLRASSDSGQIPAKKVMPPPPPAPSVVVGEPTHYTLGPEDVIEIVVRRHGEFSGTYLINAEGKIQYKFVGDIEIKGLTKSEVKDKIAGILRKFIINPEVDVTITEYKSKVIYVIGEVGAPGKYYMRADKISLREAIVQAGLPTLAASMRRTQLIRPDKTGKPKELTVDLYALLYEGRLNLDQEMYPGDVIVVPATLFAKVARILNPVAGPVLTSDTLRRAGTGGI